MAKIFEGLRVLDLSQYISGPWATTFFADQGAEVIKVEPPPFGEAYRLLTAFEKSFFALFSIVNRGKKSITLDLSKADGQVIFKKLISTTDVVVENFVPGTMDKWGVGYAALKEMNPRLIYVAISGFGSTGVEKYKQKPAFDLVIEAQSGFLDALEVEEGPPRIPIADFTAGHVAAIGISQALYYREKTGLGQFIDIAMLDVLFAINTRAQANEFVPLAAQIQGPKSFSMPVYNQYPTKDEKKVTLTTITENQWRHMCEDVLKRPDLLRDSRFDNPIRRFSYRKELDEVIRAWSTTVTREEAITALEAARIPCGEVLNIHEVFDHPQLKARGMLCDQFDFSKWGVQKATLPNRLINFSETKGTVDAIGPELGIHNEEIYCTGLGYTKDDLKRLRRKGII